MLRHQAAPHKGRRSSSSLVSHLAHETSAILLAVCLLVAACEPGTVVAPEVVVGASARVATTATFPLMIVVADPVGDNTGPIDVREMVMRFDNLSGAYEIDIAAFSTSPFSGDFRINVNLFNIDANSLFSDAINDYSLSSPLALITLTGTSASLASWKPGDRVHTNSLYGTPNPPFVSHYRTSVMSVPFAFLTNEDYIAFADGAQPAIVEPATAEAAVQHIIIDVSVLMRSGDISSDQAAGLTDKLNAILVKIAAGQRSAAINQLRAVVNQIRALIHAGLDQRLGQALIDAANNAIDLIAA